MDFRPGAVIAGRYRVERRVGAGGMGEVWAGEHLAIGSRIALKTLLSAAALNHEVVARFRREAFLLGRVRSDYVARVVDFVADDAFGLVLVMEFVEGDSLARVLIERTLSVEETIELGCDLASALTDLHRAHVVHRDLKPGNVILSPVGPERTRAVIVDFGVSRLLSAGGEDEDTITGITRADMAVGTIEYMAPEQILNSRAVTGASDIYAVGAMLFRAVAGTHVFGNIESESELAQLKLTQEGREIPIARNDRVAAGLRAVIARSIRKKPNERYRSAEELGESLGPLRDLIRVAALDLESTTQDVQQATLEAFAKGNLADADRAAPASGGRVPAGATTEPPRGPVSEAPRAEKQAEARRGVRASIAWLGAFAALGVGVAGGIFVVPRLSTGALGWRAAAADDCAAAAPARASATASSAPSATSAQSADPSPVAAAIDSDEPQDSAAARASAAPRGESAHVAAASLARDHAPPQERDAPTKSNGGATGAATARPSAPNPDAPPAPVAPKF